jgi:hypothetical protein
MENGLPSTGRDQAAHGRPEQAHTDLRRAFVSIPRLTTLAARHERDSFVEFRRRAGSSATFDALQFELVIEKWNESLS